MTADDPDAPDPTLLADRWEFLPRDDGALDIYRNGVLVGTARRAWIRGRRVNTGDATGPQGREDGSLEG